MRLQIRKDGLRNFTILTQSGKEIATCWSLKTARLFAQAPKLLDLCERVAVDLESGNDSIYDRDFVDKIEETIIDAREGE